MAINKTKSFKEVLSEIESTQNIGQGSWSLPRNATAAEKAKYELCETILGYQEDNDLSDEAMTRKTHLTQNELEDILFCRISKFNLDYLINIASNLFTSAKINIDIENKKASKGIHIQV